jgi:2-polyprenyl-3-methyl-5-hydroxy-6-metoxy-1,4-benzoquinol methylase
MVTDEKRRELLKTYFAGRVAAECEAYTTSQPTSEQARLRQRLKMAVATVCHQFPNGARVLDVGSGYGLAAGTLADLGFDVTAVEMIPELVEQAKAEHGTEVQWINQPFDAKAGKKGSFDVVLSLGFLEYQERAGKELVRMRRLLRPGGLLVLSVPNTLSHRFNFGLTRAYFRLFREPEGIPVRHSFTPERLQRCLGMAGLILLDYKWLPHGEDDLPLSIDRDRDFMNHRVKLRAEPEMLTLSRSYRPEDTAYPDDI